MTELTKSRILELFDALNAELGKQSVIGELFLVGGAVMCLAFRDRPSTKDVDGLFVPKERIREASDRVGEELGVGRGWLNNGVKMYLSREGSFNRYLELSHLRIFVAQPEYLLAMKCLAMRLGPEFHDEPDVRFLLRYLNIESYDEAVAVVTRYYPAERFPQKTFYALEEILSS